MNRREREEKDGFATDLPVGRQGHKKQRDDLFNRKEYKEGVEAAELRHNIIFFWAPAGLFAAIFCRDRAYLLHTIIDGMRQKGFPRRSLALGFLPDYHLRLFQNPHHLRDLRANVLSG